MVDAFYDMVDALLSYRWIWWWSLIEIGEGGVFIDLLWAAEYWEVVFVEGSDPCYCSFQVSEVVVDQDADEYDGIED